jgi:hypothetical protein
MRVGGLTCDEIVRDAFAFEDGGEAAAAFSGGDAEQNAGLGGQGEQRLADAGIERVVMRPIAAQNCEGILVGLRKCGDVATRRRIASWSERPTTESVSARLGAGRPASRNAASMAATIMCWLSTRVPSQSKTTSFNAYPPRGLRGGRAVRRATR